MYIEINNKYRIKKIPFNYQIQEFDFGGREITTGPFKGQITQPKWRPLESYHSSLAKAVGAVYKLMVDNALLEQGSVDLWEAADILESISKKLLEDVKEALQAADTTLTTTNPMV